MFGEIWGGCDLGFRDGGPGQGPCCVDVERRVAKGVNESSRGSTDES